jgi:glycosyltransferase involved in cell wall biosynthesis
MKHTSCTCIIPFYNEEERVITVIQKIANVKQFDKIILVNDGSQDNSLQLVKTFVAQHKDKHIHIVSYTKNKGKTNAIKEGLKQVKTEYICMFDSDLKNIKIQEIIHMIKHIFDHPEIDMGIMRRIRAKRYIKLLYRELILSGQRILKTQDLHNVFQQPCEKYQLEVAINTYMEIHKKTVVRYPFSGENSQKSQKRGIINGRKRDINMFRDIFKYQGIRGYMRHSLMFSPINEKKYIPSKKIR